MNPRLSLVNLALARLYLGLGKADEAIQFSQAELQLVPGQPEAQLLLARAQLAKRNPGAAQSPLSSLTAAFPNTPDVQAEVGRMYLQKGDFSRR